MDSGLANCGEKERGAEMEILEQRVHSEAHILCVTIPAQGHANAMLQFCKRLASKGLKVTLLSSKTDDYKFIQTQASSINVELITKHNPKSATIYEFFGLYKIFVSQNIEKKFCSEWPPTFIIYDSLLPWTLDIARSFGIDGAPFFTQPWAVNSIYYHFHRGAFRIPLEESVVLLPSMPPLKMNDLPSCFDGTDADTTLLELAVSQVSKIEEPKWIFCNSFDKLEDEVVKWMASQYPIKNVGPTIPSIYLDKRLENDKDYSLSLFKPNSEACIKWLDSKETDSVVYLSFGSFVTLGEEQMAELAWGLKSSISHFLWVVRESEQEKLPGNFSEEISEKGLVVSWSPQLEVLSHKSVGCFMTHCGWNSTLEALSLGMPMVAMPQRSDQTTNAKFIADVWQTGIRVRVDEKGIVTREEIEKCIREVMQGERAKDIRKNSQRWKEWSKEAIDDGGSSDKSIKEFVAEILRS